MKFSELLKQISELIEHYVRSPQEPAARGEDVPPLPAKDNTLAIARFDFLKWFLGTFVLGVATIWSTHIVKDFELRQKTRQEESVYLKPYFETYMKLVKEDTLYNQQAAMAKFLSFTVVDPEFKKGWQNLSDYCEAKLSKLQHQRDSIGQLNNTLKARKKVEVEKLYEHKEGTKTVSPAQVAVIKQNIASLDQQIDQNANKAEVIASKVEPVPVKPEPKFVETSTDELMCKANRYILINRTLRIFVNSIDSDEKTVNISLLDVENGKFDEFVPELIMKAGETKEITAPNGKYKFSIRVTGVTIRAIAYNYANFKVTTFKLVN